VRFVLAAAVKDVRRRLADPAAIAIWIGIPLVLSGMLSFIANTGGNAPLRAHVLLVDQDDTVISRLLSAAARQGNSPIDIEPVTLAAGHTRMDAGDATALLIIPRGFQNAVTGTGSATLQLVTNPSQRVLPGLVQQMLDSLVDAAFYGQQLFAEPIQRIARSTQGPPSNAEVAAIAVDITGRITGLQGVLLPPVVSLSMKTLEAGPRLNFGQVFLPGMLFMSFLFIAQGMGFDVWEEKRTGALRRLLTTPQSPGRLLLGKLLAGIVVTSIVALFGLLASVMWFDLAWSRIPAALLWCTFVSGALIALLMLLHLSAGTQRSSELLSSVVTFPLMMLGGSFFPLEQMPAWMAAAGRWTPNGLGVARLKELLYGSVSATSIGIAILGIGIPAVIAFIASHRRLRSFANA
jgi:ABC-type multidrug transport system permease subunit